MIRLAEREQILRWVDEASAQGARREQACALLGISVRTLQRWRDEAGTIGDDGRCQRTFVPANKLTDAEREQILAIANRAEFAALPPSQLVPMLAERGEYIASESSFYRVLREAKQLNHRLASRPATHHKPAPLQASAPNELYSWDITYLKTPLAGVYFYLYLVMDIYSRKIVGWCVQDRENSDYAAQLVREIAAREGLPPDQVTLHSDNGTPMKGATLLATLHALGIVPSFSRPAVSNDNPFSESLFKTLKYRPNYPTQAFADLSAARRWVADFVDWYNHHHRHSAIRFVTPAQRHAGLDTAILAQRAATYAAAKARHPQRWTQHTRNWTPIPLVWLNPKNSQQPKEVLNS
jgi:transposase InsO family protein